MHLPVEVDAQRARGAALLGERDGRGLLGERHLGQAYRRRGRGGRRGRCDRRAHGHRRCDGRRRGGGLRGGRRVLRLVHGDAEVRGQARQAAAVALSDRAELPGALPAVELAEHERRFDTGARVVEAGDHRALRRVPDLDVQIGDLPERSSVGGGGEDHGLDRGLHAREVDEQGVRHPAPTVPLALVPDRPGGVHGLVVEDEVAVGTDLSGHQEQRGGVRVGDTRSGAPAQLDPERRRGHRDVRSLGH